MRLIDAVDLCAARLTVRADAGFTRRYLLDDFFVEYSEAIGLDRMPRSIALVPFVLNVAPLVWFSGETWRIDELDSVLAEALETLRALMRRQFPAHGWTGELAADRLVDNRAATAGMEADEPVCLLFTGGVDSTYTSLSQYPKRQALISLWGNETDVGDERRWRPFQASCERFARQFDHRNLFVKSNGKEIVRRKRIAPDIAVWWYNVQISMALVGHCVPALYHWCRPWVCISSGTYGFDGPVGTSPKIDQNIRCAGIGVRYIGADRTRQDKLNFIVDAAARHDLPAPHLVVCSRASVQGTNCGSCEKCLRTMTGVLVAGGRLRDFGFARDDAEVIADVRRRVAKRRLNMHGNRSREWRFIGDAASKALHGDRLADASPEVRDFAAWLRDLDVDRYVTAQRWRQRLTNRAKWALSANPWLYETVRRTLERRGWFGY